MSAQSFTAIIEQAAAASSYSGTVLLKQHGAPLAALSSGYASLADRRLNRIDTRFGLASGAKLLTAVAICQLMDQGKLTPDSRVLDILQRSDFPRFAPDITVHHLLTHSSGIPDYFDEETMEDFSALWIERPMYRLLQPRDFLPMFSGQPMKFVPGARFHYNNAGYIMLGLLVEAISGESFAEYVEGRILRPCRMGHSGYYTLDELPENTATGYIEDEAGRIRTNIYSIPVKGGPDGGVFASAPDVLRLWEELIGQRLLSATMTAAMLTPHIHAGGEEYYGYGVWITKRGGEILKYHLMGYDPGVSFHSAYYPGSGISVAALCNRSKGAYSIIRAVEEALALQEES
ncbi:serine hydrolase domain-containing protein [Paenibacillus tepidiphilus]|uniref:serine hydrolase domain-containing protein n=1 Tax=Paenibacillus tepidiphilus TaxID=2608683 RepID=UPI00123BD8C9|nr:serine hydrolase domain-containing protein [Paenibacillus tepidiphilus]